MSCDYQASSDCRRVWRVGSAFSTIESKYIRKTSPTHLYARDPLLGPTGNCSNVLTRLGDLLVNEYDGVMLIPFTRGGTSLDDWSPGMRSYISASLACYWPLTYAIKQIKRAKIELTAILWQQGKAEICYHNYDNDLYIWRSLSVACVIRKRRLTAPIYIAQCTRTLREAQRRHGEYPGIKAGPIVIERTQDGHFSATGLQRAAELWYAALKS
jgi:hypothetical protein